MKSTALFFLEWKIGWSTESFGGMWLNLGGLNLLDAISKLLYFQCFFCDFLENIQVWHNHPVSTTVLQSTSMFSPVV